MPALDPEVASLVRGGATLGALPGSREEAAAVVRLYAPGARMWVGDDASERRARSVDPSTRIVHFAVHGVVNERFPLNSALVFTIPDGPAAPEDNGLLQAWEIMEHMRLRADLVVLSACDTAVGRAGGGEGLLTLARAFHFAGARSVLATLWRVDDRASARLMTRFYQELRAGATRTEALRAAQVSFIKDSRLSDPAGWAAYSLSGE